MRPPLRVLMGMVFYPRGGSAQVVRYLSRALREWGHEVHLVVGTLRDGDPEHDAKEFFGDLPLTLADYSEAWRGFQAGEDAISGNWKVPFHPSYEDKPGVPDRVFYRVPREDLRRLVRCWEGLLVKAADDFRPHVLHLHHLNHLHLAARTLEPVPTVAHLHGTELKMLERMKELRQDPALSRAELDFWYATLLEAAAQAGHFFAISPDVRDRARALLDLDEARISMLPNGVDTSLFRPQDWSDEQKLHFLQRILVDDPRGWDESGTVGSVAYRSEDLERFRGEAGELKPLLLFVGRFLDFKRVPLLLEAVARVNRMLAGRGGGPPFNLLIWGGMPGEWEGEHPHTVAMRLGLANVFFAGWLPHDVLKEGLNLADVFVAPSYFEPFGQVFLEAMATRLPVIATKSGGPLGFVVDSGDLANGWFCDVDDLDSLAETIRAAISDSTERRRRGANAHELVQRRFAWRTVAREFIEAYGRLLERTPS